MKYLIDTHVLLWYLDGDTSLPKQIAQDLDDAEKIVVSIVSFWELTIKVSLKKLQLNKAMFFVQEAISADSRYDILNISFDHLNTLSTLRFHHQDPFDRLLIAQAIKENLPIVTADRQFINYPAKVVWK